MQATVKEISKEKTVEKNKYNEDKKSCLMSHKNANYKNCHYSLQGSLASTKIQIVRIAMIDRLR